MVSNANKEKIHESFNFSKLLIAIQYYTNAT